MKKNEKKSFLPPFQAGKRAYLKVVAVRDQPQAARSARAINNGRGAAIKKINIFFWRIWV